MPRREDRSSLVYYLIYLLIATMFLKLFRILPRSPEYEVVTVTLSISGFAIMLLTLFQQWLSGRFRRLEERFDEISELVRHIDGRVTDVEHGFENVKLTERLARLEEKLEG